MNRVQRVSQLIRKAVFQDLPDTGEMTDLDRESADLYGDWTREFETPNGELIRVTFSKSYIAEGVWAVQMSGGSGRWRTFNPTRKGEQWFVYKQLLGIVKRFIEDVKPAKLKFKGHTPKQHDLYKRFLNRFFPSSQWVDQGGTIFLFDPANQRTQSRQAVFQDLPKMGLVDNRESTDFRNDLSVVTPKVTSEFATSDGKVYETRFYPQDDRSVEITFGPKFQLPRGRSEKTFEVFKYVLGAVKQYIEEYDPQKLYFVAARPELEDTYTKFLERFFPGKWEGRWGEFTVDLKGDNPQASRQAVLSPGELPPGVGEFRDSEAEGLYRWRTVDKKFSTSDGVEYYVDFELDNANYRGDEGDVWEISFGNLPGYDDRRPTPSKKTYEVMQNVAAIIRDFITEYEPQKISFMPTTYSRRKLYLAMVRRFFPEAEVRSDAGTVEVTLREAPDSSNTVFWS